ncbi:hypothetical protein CC86DRAFT_105424 [Ophiobolus disseminans]|uniref:Uncharacterized protein n=1 Tax=Ophiobolus disseminans TaxID=1469910 RepID=A0A6A6ZMM6_9PLEO|nr:hypothetical protein CC86DRAFT_105424 [Ophiobolus disseminans]
MDVSQAAQGGSQEILSPAAAAGSSSSPLSSPLSEVGPEHKLDTPDATSQIHQEDGSFEDDAEGDTENLEEDEAHNGASLLSSTMPTPAKEASDSDDDKKEFQCPHCDKLYDKEKSLKRHLGDKKSVCFRNRGDDAVEGPPQWACNRCRAPLAKRHTVERHIEGSCWKVCDGCTESNSENCDANVVEGACTNCVKAGKSSCTKHEGPVPGSAPVLLTAAPAVSHNEDHRIRSPTARRSKKRTKRKAVESPDASPQPKAKPKRIMRGVKKEKEPTRHSGGDAEEETPSEPDHGPGITVDNATPQRLPPAMVPSQPLRGHNHLLGHNLLPAFEPKLQSNRRIYQPQRQGHPSNGHGFSDLPPGPHPSHVLPSMPANNSMGVARGSQHAPTTREMLPRQGLWSQYGGEYGTGLQQLATVSDLRSSLNMGQNQLGSRAFAFGNARDSLPSNFRVHPDRPFNHMNPDEQPAFGISVPNSRGASRRSSMADVENFELPRGSAPHSRAQSRHSSVVFGQHSAPGSRVPSRQSSRQPSIERMRPRHGNDMDQSGGQNDEDEHSRLMVKLPLPRELKFKLALESASAEAVNPSSQPLCIRIHSNTYDSNGSAIFSILSMLANEPFGPRLEYYCQARGKRLNVDWKFIYKYPAPTDANLARRRYLDLAWNVTPAMVRDKEYPACAIKDGDTIYVVNRRTPIDPEADDIGTQLGVQRIYIRDGEMKIWQKRDINEAWYRHAEQTALTSRNENANLKNLISKMGNDHARLESQMAHLITRNAQLQNENAMLRQMRMQAPMVPQQRQSHQQMNLYMAHALAAQSSQYQGQTQNQFSSQNQMSAYGNYGAQQPQNAYSPYPPVHNYTAHDVRGEEGVHRPVEAHEGALGRDEDEE